MNNLIKFRVWDKRYNEYVSDGCAQAITNEGKFILGYCDFYSSFTNTNSDDFVIEYSTGYKSIDGKELYVNDIIEYQLGLKIIRCRITFDHFGFFNAEVRGGYMNFTQQKYTLLGNSNQNPELLK